MAIRWRYVSRFDKPEKDHLIQIEEPRTIEADEEGIETAQWVPVKKLWCSVETRSGSQKWADGRYQAEVSALFTYNWIPDWEPTADMRVRYNNKLYDIVAVDNIRGKNLEVEIQGERIESAKGSHL